MINNFTELSCDVIQDINFNAIMTYDDWTVFMFKDKYYVADNDIQEVVLVSKCKPEDYTGEDPDVVWLDADYCGESDDGKMFLGFDRVKNEEKDRDCTEFGEHYVQ